MRLNARVDVKLKTKDLQDAGAAYAEEILLSVGQEVVGQARRNVAPGFGPGPHPHKIGSHHVDTGALAASVQAEITRQGDVSSLRVWTDLAYGTYLEAGWHSRSGNFWRYPWLAPALLAGQAAISGAARAAGLAFGGRGRRSHYGPADFESSEYLSG